MKPADERILQGTAIAVSEATGEEFFRLLVKHLAETLAADFAVIGTLAPGNKSRIRTIAYFGKGHWQENIEYDLAGTPCENVMQQSTCVYASGVQQRFPSDAWLRDFGIVSYAGTPLVDSHGQVLGLISVLGRQPLEDLEAIKSALRIFAVRTAVELELHQAEASLRTSQLALAESEQQFRQMAETIRDVYWLYDMQQLKLLYVSPAFETIWGRPAEWLYSDPTRWTDAVHEDDLERARRIGAPQAPGKMFDEIYRIVRPGGEVRWIHDRRYAVFNAAGEFYRQTGVAEDITQRHEATERIEQQASHLAHMSRLSTVGQLVASIAHEVNQPLYTIANYASAIGAILKSPVPQNLEQVTQWNDEIGKAAHRAGEIIRRIRAYVTQGPTPRAWTDVNAVVRESVALLAAEARRQRAPIEFDLAEELPKVQADAVALQQVLVNLLRNALEAMQKTPAQERRIVVATRGGESSVEISVADAGCGLCEEARSRIFTEFYTSKPQGMGLGLAICKTIVSAHQGRIWASSEKGETTFHISLPVKPVERNSEVK